MAPGSKPTKSERRQASKELHLKRAITELQRGHYYNAKLPRGYRLQVRWAWYLPNPETERFIVVDKWKHNGQARLAKQVECDGFLMLRIELMRLL